MIERHSYQGTLNGVNGIWCDQKPKGLKNVKDITFYTADEGKVFVDKNGVMTDSVVIVEGVDIKDFTEIVKPQTEEHNPDAPQGE